MNSFSFGTLNLTLDRMRQYALSIDGADTFLTPEWDYEFIEIPGRNGNLTLDNNRMKNVTLVFHCFIRTNFPANFRNLMNAFARIRGYAKLKYSDDPDHFRMAVFKTAVSAETGSFNKSGHFDLEFSCKPERFYDSGDEFETLAYGSGDAQGFATPQFATTFPSSPVFRIYGKGTVEYAMSGDEHYTKITVDEHPYEYIDIDSSTLTASYGTTNLSNYVQLSNGYPELVGYMNKRISWELEDYGNGAGLKIKPRTFDI